jgi:hypothetical protein
MFWLSVSGKYLKMCKSTLYFQLPKFPVLLPIQPDKCLDLSEQMPPYEDAILQSQKYHQKTGNTSGRTKQASNNNSSRIRS